MDYFLKISSIPRGSGNEAAIAAYVETFAAERGFFHKKDAWNNVFVRRPASVGYEDHPPVVLQGHMDMVCEANQDTIHDFTKDPIEVIRDGDILRANGTTLGADDGVAVAIMLALLDTPDLCSPALECIFTTEEETSLGGIQHFDTSIVTGRRMINLDSAGEGIATAACAGGLRTILDVPFICEQIPDGYALLCINVGGLCGGHSGEDIHRGRMPAISAMAKILDMVSHSCELQLLSISGGSKENAIPRECTATIAVSDASIAMNTIKTAENLLRSRLVDDDRPFFVNVADGEGNRCVSAADTAKIIALLRILPIGIRAMSRDIPGVVETSCNLGVLRTNPDAFYMSFRSRSFLETELSNLETLLENCASLVGASVIHESRYPAWTFCTDSDMQRLYLETWKSLYGTEAQITAIHAGLECGFFLKEIPTMDAIAIGPELHNLHSPSETCTVSSFARLYTLILSMLKAM